MISTTYNQVLWILLIFLSKQLHVLAFVPNLSILQTKRTKLQTALYDSSKKDASGYKFGDISRGVFKKLGSSVNKVTGKEKYEFGDLSRHIDSKIKDKVADISGKEEYEFGDLSRHIDSRIKDKVADLSGKEKYEFGDLSKEIVRRILSGDINLKDIAILLKTLTSFGLGMSSVSTFMPMHFLIELLNFSIASDIGERVVTELSQEVDKRVKKAVTGDENYKLGDYTKAQILKFTGKNEYNFGDISKAIAEQQKTAVNNTGGQSLFMSPIQGSQETATIVDVEILEDLKKMDKLLAIETKIPVDGKEKGA